MNRKWVTWLTMGAAIIVVAAVRLATASDADKKADQAKISAGMNNFMIGQDKTGKLAQADALGKFFTFCKANLEPNDSGVAFSDDEKKSYCGCATLGMQKLYYARLSPDELIDISKRPSAPDLGPEDTQRQVFAACGASRDAYSQ